MANIFENSKFGDFFKTRDGRKAVAVEISQKHNYPISFFIEGYNSFGKVKYLSGDDEITFLTPWMDEEIRGCCDIVSRWEEKIDESKIDKIAEALSPFNFDDFDENNRYYHDGYKLGFKEGVNYKIKNNR